MSGSTQSSEAPVIPVLVVDNDPDRLGRIARALHEPDGTVAPYSLWCFTRVEDVLKNPPQRDPVVFLTSASADQLAGLDLGPVITLGDDETALRATVTKTLRAHVTEQPGRINGRIVAWWRHDLARRAERLRAAISEATTIVHELSSRYGEPLKLMRRFPGVLTDRMDEAPCSEQAEVIDRMEHAVTALEEAAVQLLPTEERTVERRERRPALRLVGATATVAAPPIEPPRDPGFAILSSRPALRIQSEERSVVSDYMERVARLRQAPASLALVRFTLCDPECSLDDLDRFLRPGNGPADLLLDVGDDCSLIALRATDDPLAWIDRVQGAWWAAVLRGSAYVGTAFETDWIGSWPWPPSEELLTLLGARRDFAQAA